MPWSSDVHALAAEVIYHRQALEAPAVDQCVHHEVRTPGVIDMAAAYQGLTLVRRALDLAAFARRQVRQLVQAPHALVIDLLALKTQQVVDMPLVKPAVLMRQLDDTCAQTDH